MYLNFSGTIFKMIERKDIGSTWNGSFFTLPDARDKIISQKLQFITEK